MNQEHVDLLKQGAETWNKWRRNNPYILPDFLEANLSGLNLRGFNLGEPEFSAYSTGADGGVQGADLRSAWLEATDLSGANLKGAKLNKAKLDFAKLTEANLFEANLCYASFKQADLGGANLEEVDLSSSYLNKANLSGANLSEANLKKADLSGADLRGANLEGAIMINTTLDGANLEKCTVYGVAAWDLIGEPANQTNLLITPAGQPEVTVDDLEVAQFIYLILNNRKIRDAIDTVTSKGVLILGRFKPERKAVLDAIKVRLRALGFLPILFDFENSEHKDLSGTIKTLSNLSRFVIADLTEPSSIPHELGLIIPDSPSLPVQMIIEEGNFEFAMAERWFRYPWVMDLYKYPSKEALIESLESDILEPCEERFKELNATIKRWA